MTAQEQERFIEQCFELAQIEFSSLKQELKWDREIRAQISSAIKEWREVVPDRNWYDFVIRMPSYKTAAIPWNRQYKIDGWTVDLTFRESWAMGGTSFDVSARRRF